MSIQPDLEIRADDFEEQPTRSALKSIKRDSNGDMDLGHFHPYFELGENIVAGDVVTNIGNKAYKINESSNFSQLASISTGLFTNRQESHARHQTANRLGEVVTLFQTDAGLRLSTFTVTATAINLPTDSKLLSSQNHANINEQAYALKYVPEKDFFVTVHSLTTPLNSFAIISEWSLVAGVLTEVATANIALITSGSVSVDVEFDSTNNKYVFSYYYNANHYIKTINSNTLADESQVIIPVSGGTFSTKLKYIAEYGKVFFLFGSNDVSAFSFSGVFFDSSTNTLGTTKTFISVNINTNVTAIHDVEYVASTRTLHAYLVARNENRSGVLQITFSSETDFTSNTLGFNVSSTEIQEGCAALSGSVFGIAQGFVRQGENDATFSSPASGAFPNIKHFASSTLFFGLSINYIEQINRYLMLLIENESGRPVTAILLEAPQAVDADIILGVASESGSTGEFKRVALPGQVATGLVGAFGQKIFVGAIEVARFIDSTRAVVHL